MSTGSANKPWAVLDVDTNLNNLGLPCLLGENLGEGTVLSTTIGNILASDFFAGVVVAVRRDQLDTCQEWAGDVAVTWHAHDHEIEPRHQYLRGRRKWSRFAWRGGVDHSYLFCEGSRLFLLSEIISAHDIDVAVSIDPAAPLIATDILAGIQERFESTADQLGMGYATSVPGLNYLFVNQTFAAMVGKEHGSMREVLRYNPAAPQIGPYGLPCCYVVPLEVSSLRARFMADTQRGLAQLRALLSTGKPLNTGPEIISAMETCEWASVGVHTYPLEVELEITGRSKVQDSLWPEGKTSRSETDMSLEHVKALAEELKACDDTLLTLGGYGDPCLHPQLDEILKLLKSSAWGLHVDTSAGGLTPDVIDLLVKHKVDMVSVRLDAFEADTYASLKSGLSYDEAVAATDALILAFHQAGLPTSSVVPVFTKVDENMGEMEAFYDHWYEKTQWVVIRGFDDMAGQLEDRNVLRILPTQRKPCFRLHEQLSIWADGKVMTSPQDYLGKHPIGSLNDGITQVWQSESYQNLRRRQRDGKANNTHLCEYCQHWDHVDSVRRAQESMMDEGQPGE